jgi:O-antigen/teichoic acid export membrane protein
LDTISIDRKDVYWNYIATFLQIASGVLLFPLILKFLPQETIGIWTIFTSISTFVFLFDFGFSSSFTRNVTYVFSGVKTLKATGFEVNDGNGEIDYGLLKGLINVMRYFYSRIAFILLAVLLTLGTYYIFLIIETYSGNKREIIIAYFFLCLVNSYSLYTLYYDALLLGMGLVKRSKQIAIIGYILYLSVSILLILAGFGLVALTSAQAVSVILRRILVYQSIYKKELKYYLKNISVSPQKNKEILKAIYPNAVKIGLTGVGGILVLRSQPIIGSFYLSLETIASYGITIQLISILSGVAQVYFSTYQPKIVQYRVQNNIYAIKNLYIKSIFILVCVFVAGGSVLLLFGNWGMNLIGSKTPLLPNVYIAVALFVALLEANHGIAGNFLLTKNQVPFFKAALIAGLTTVILLFLFLRFLSIGLWALILSGGIAQIIYQNWKWPLEVVKEFKTAL